MTQPGHSEIASSTSLHSVYLYLQQARSVSSHFRTIAIPSMVGATLAVALETIVTLELETIVCYLYSTYFSLKLFSPKLAVLSSSESTGPI